MNGTRHPLLVEIDADCHAGHSTRAAPRPAPRLKWRSPSVRLEFHEEMLRFNVASIRLGEARYCAPGPSLLSRMLRG